MSSANGEFYVYEHETDGLQRFVSLSIALSIVALGIGFFLSTALFVLGGVGLITTIFSLALYKQQHVEPHRYATGSAQDNETLYDDDMVPLWDQIKVELVYPMAVIAFLFAVLSIIAPRIV